ncbi:hypothetical protein B0A50_06033 [Salinomyces thailandicus]|uniref:Protein kinase domain-containing protein n=1 Tax=Salinomyces thailandicus TaxID=706561 RepID=A0A4U0TSZ7_9PEZI|nr:hypothetical protein B0A50_06033 [Salinomyces thailandica]
MFTKALSSLTSNISSAYSLSTQPTSTAGPWNIFDAKHRKSGKPVSVFVFSAKSLDAGNSHGGLGGRSSGGLSLKRAQEEVVERLKREASALARLRHPSILELAEPVEETRSGGLMFATEPVTASLAQVLVEKDSAERGSVGGRGSKFYVEEADGTRRRKEVEMDELEIQKGLLQLGKGLEFLHESAGLVHANLTPEAIMINAKGDWKIAGLAFCGPHESSTAATSMPPISLHEALSHDPRLPRSVQLNLDYTSPDFVLDNRLTASADMFSLGLLILALYNNPHTSPISPGGSLSSYKRIFSSSATLPTQHNNFLVPASSSLPPKLATDLLPRLITRRPVQRLSARDFQEAAYFDNILVSTIRFIDALPAKTAAEKTAFLRGFPRILPQFPKSVLEKKVLPALLEETKDRELIAAILTNVFAMVKVMPTGKRAFSTLVVPKLTAVFLSNGPLSASANRAATPQPAADKDTSREAGLMVLLDHLPTAAELCDGRTFRESILPLLLLALDSPTHALVDAALTTLPTVLPVLDFTTTKHDLFPAVAAVFARTSSLAIKIRGLEAFYTLCGGRASDSSNPGDLDDDDFTGLPSNTTSSSSSSSVILDKHTIQETLFPLLRAIKTREPAVMLAALRVFTQIGKICDPEFLALEVLPVLWRWSLGPLLSLEGFKGFMTCIRRVSGRVEAWQIERLRGLGGDSGAGGGVEVGAQWGLGTAGGDMGGTGAGVGAGGGGGDSEFEMLVSGRKPGNGAGMGGPDLMADWGATPSAAARAPATASPAFSWQANPTGSQTSQQQQQQRRPAHPPSSSSNPALTALRNPSAGSALSNSNSIARTVTPDTHASSKQSLNSFATLTPQSAFSSPLVPERSGSGSAMQRNSSWNGAGTATASGLAMRGPPPPQQQWSSGTSGMSFHGNGNANGNSNTAGSSIDWSAASASARLPPPPVQKSGFGIPPPPATRTLPLQQQQQQKGTGTKAGAGAEAGGGGGSTGGGGLDRYESLI